MASKISCISCGLCEGDDLVKLKCKRHFKCRECMFLCENCNQPTINFVSDQLQSSCTTDGDNTASRPSRDVFVYMDDSNLWIEAKKQLGSRGKEDPGIRIDVGNILHVLAKGRNVVSAKLYGSEPPPVDTFWAKAEERGWKVFVNERSKFTGKEKRVDTKLVAHATKDACEYYPPRTMIFISGDADIIEAIKIALEKSWNVEVYMWQRATSNEFRKLKGCQVECLDKYAEKIIFRDGMKYPVSANKECLSDARTYGIVCKVTFTHKTSLRRWLGDFERRFKCHCRYFWLQELYPSAKDNMLVLVSEQDVPSNKIADIIKAHQREKVMGIEEMQSFLQFEQEQKQMVSDSQKKPLIEKQSDLCLYMSSEVDCNLESEDEFFSVASIMNDESQIFLEPEPDIGNGKDITDDSDEGGIWKKVKPKKRKKKPKKQLHSKPCENGIYCYDGSNCAYKHSQAEKDYFQSNRGHGKIPKKSKLCYNYPHCQREDKECNYAHGEQDAHCFKCSTTGHFPANCDKNSKDIA